MVLGIPLLAKSQFHDLIDSMHRIVLAFLFSYTLSNVLVKTIDSCVLASSFVPWSMYSIYAPIKGEEEMKMRLFSWMLNLN